MKDLVIKQRTIKINLWALFCSFLLASGIHVHGIMKYNTRWTELWNYLHVTLLMTLIIYLLVLLLYGFTIYGRMLFVFIRKNAKK